MCLCWGSGQHGKLGIVNSEELHYSQPRKMTALADEKVAEFAAGPFHTLILTCTGKILACGSYKDHKLGLHKATGKASESDKQGQFTDVPTQIASNGLVFHQ